MNAKYLGVGSVEQQKRRMMCFCGGTGSKILRDFTEVKSTESDDMDVTLEQVKPTVLTIQQAQLSNSTRSIIPAKRFESSKRALILCQKNTLKRFKSSTTCVTSSALFETTTTPLTFMEIS